MIVTCVKCVILDENFGVRCFRIYSSFGFSLSHVMIVFELCFHPVVAGTTHYSALLRLYSTSLSLPAFALCVLVLC